MNLRPANYRRVVYLFLAQAINAISAKVALHNKAAHEYAADATKSQTIDGD